MGLGTFLKLHKKKEEEIALAAGGFALSSAIRAAAIFAAGAAAAATVAVTVVQTPPPYHPTLHLSPRGAAFISRFEGDVLHPYNDAVVACTIGIGHLIHYGGCTSADYSHWRGFTRDQSVALFVSDAERYASAVRQAVTRPISQSAFDALVSFAYNIGTGGMASSSALRAINSGALAEVQTDFLKWDRAGGRVLAGLYTRRLGEAHLVLTGDYGDAGRWLGNPYPAAPILTGLQARTGYYAWLAWYLGQGDWRAYGLRNAKVRPNVPAHVPASWWARAALHVSHG